MPSTRGTASTNSSPRRSGKRLKRHSATSYPSPGELILYPGGVSETELLLAYGYVAFASKAGALAGNHFASVTSGQENLRALGKKLLWEGAQEIRFSEV